MIFFQHIGAPLRAAANAQCACHCKCCKLFLGAFDWRKVFQDHAANVAAYFLLFRCSAVTKVQRVRVLIGFTECLQ